MIADAFDVELEYEALTRTFVEMRQSGAAWLTMARLHTSKGVMTVMFDLPDADLTAIALGVAIIDRSATKVMLAQDAWFNTLKKHDGDPRAAGWEPPEGYLRPADDPLAGEAFVVSFFTEDDAEVIIRSYRMENDTVVWGKRENDTGDTSSRATLPIQLALKVAGMP
jgi:hypothetical protein